MVDMFNWFKPKNKNTVVIPVKGSKGLSGMELIKAFTTVDEPKLVDFPKDKYTVYWEINVDSVDAGYTALVRFYDYFGKTVKEQSFGAITVDELKAAVNKEIVSTMKQYVR